MTYMFKAIHNCLQMYLKTLGISVLKSCSFFVWLKSLLKKTKMNLELLTNIDMLLIVEKGLRGGICQVTHRYAKANNKHMKNYD